MEFNFSINVVFKEKLSKIGSDLLPNNYLPDRRGEGDVVSKVSAVLDKMGIVSAKAQKLPAPITSAAKLRNSDHIVYVLTEPESNRGHGSVVGILKVGLKKLFIYDSNGTQCEMIPLCVLDFYVHESKQRIGCGRTLFEFMLKDQNVKPQHLALDQPSESFLSFMSRHYGFESIIPQIYNFVVYVNFFDGRADTYRCSSNAGESNSESRSGLSCKANKNSIQSVKATSCFGENTSYQVYGRHSAKKAGCTMAEYMQDAAIAQNGTKQGSHSTNHETTPSKTSPSFGVSKQGSSFNPYLEDNKHRPTSLPSKLEGPSASLSVETSAQASSHQERGMDGAEVLRESHVLNGTAATSPDEVIGIHGSHTRSGPTYSAGLIMRGDPASASEGMNQHEMYNARQVRKISNIPMGSDSEEDDGDGGQSFAADAASMKQDGNPHSFDSAGLKDVRIKKTNFKNLSPFRR